MIVLTRSETQGLLTLEEFVPAVESAFRERGRARGLEAKRFHVLAGVHGIALHPMGAVIGNTYEKCDKLHVFEFL